MLSLRFNPQIINSLTRRKLLRNKEFCYLRDQGKIFSNKHSSLPLFKTGGNTIFLFSCFQPFHLAFTNFKTNYRIFSLKKEHLIRLIRIRVYWQIIYIEYKQQRAQDSTSVGKSYRYCSLIRLGIPIHVSNLTVLMFSRSFHRSGCGQPFL